MNFERGQLIKVKFGYVHDDEPNVGCIIDIIPARDHEVKAVQDVASIEGNQDLKIIKVLFGNSHIREFFDDELEGLTDV